MNPNVTFPRFSFLLLTSGLRVLGAFFFWQKTRRLLNFLRHWCSLCSGPRVPCNKYNLLLVILLLTQKFAVYGMVPYLFGFLLSRADRLIVVFKFSPDISPSVSSCSASSSGFVRIGAYRPSRSEVSYVFGVGVPTSSGISSSSS